MQQSPQNQDLIKVWDIVVRIFHWAMVLLFSAAFLTGEFRANEIHIWLGYGVGALLLARLVWGVIGTPYARISSWIFSSRETLAYIRGSLAGHPKDYAGHNPLGSLMVIALIIMISTIVTSGLLIAGAIEFEGPLLDLTQSMGDAEAYALKTLHEILAIGTLLLITLHVLGAIVASIQHRENLIKAMFTGYKKRPPSAAVMPAAERREK